jgi:hypothetical protein
MSGLLLGGVAGYGDHLYLASPQPSALLDLDHREH